MDPCLIVMSLNVSLCGFGEDNAGQVEEWSSVGCEEARPRTSKKCCGDATSPIGYQHELAVTTAFSTQVLSLIWHSKDFLV